MDKKKNELLKEMIRSTLPGAYCVQYLSKGKCYVIPLGYCNCSLKIGFLRHLLYLKALTKGLSD